MRIGYCVCTNCNYSMPTPKGLDCTSVKCPKCGGIMKNKGYETLDSISERKLTPPKCSKKSK